MKNLIYILLLIPMSIFAQDSHTEQRTYQYDNLNRLIKVVFTNGETYEYQYDNLGNRTQLTAVTEVEQTYVPDDNFEQALIDLGYDSGVLDDYVFTHNINEIIELEIYDKGIEDLTGIEDFELLENLQVSNNLLTTLGVSQNANLKQLNCGNNSLNDIDVSQNSALESLYIAHNQLTGLNILNNLNLDYLSCHHNNISTLDVTQNTLLKSLDFQYNNLTSIDIQQNVLLEYFNAQENSLSEIDFSQNPLLETIIIPHNNLNSLDVTNQSLLVQLWANHNNISEIDLSNNTLLYQIYIFYNNLSELNVQQNINLHDLSCYNNNLTNIHFGNNHLLEEVYCKNNSITNIDVSNLNMLRTFNISNNQLTSLDVHLNPLIFRLWCLDNDLTSLNVKNGNNQGILSMSSQNNPNLTCIQVDNENDANNGVGVYSDWQKDTFVSYSEDCNQSSTIQLPYDNYAVNTIGLTCINSNDGVIHILANLERIYNIEVTSTENNYHENFVLNGYQYWDIFIEYLKGGEYTVIITLDGISYEDYHKTFILNIDEPEPLQAARMANGTTQTVTMNGTAPFFILLNAILIAETNETEYTFEAQNGDELEIKTSNSCEGKYSEIINISEVVIIYPNPTNDNLNFVANTFINGDVIEIKLVDINGRLVEVFTSNVSNSKVSISIEHLSSGIYFVEFPSLNNQTFKIVKE